MIRNISYFFSSYMLPSITPAASVLPSPSLSLTVSGFLACSFSIELFADTGRTPNGGKTVESVMHKQHDNISLTFQYCNIESSGLVTRIKKKKKKNGTEHGCYLDWRDIGRMITSCGLRRHII